MNNGSVPVWVQDSQENDPHLQDLLHYAAGNYDRHTNWFLRHRDTGLRNLAALLTAEVAIAGLWFSSLQVPNNLFVFVLVILSVSSPILFLSAYYSCRNSYKASLENALLVSKIVWAMGLATKVKIDMKLIDMVNIPAKLDNTLYIPRYWKDACLSDGSASFLRSHMRFSKCSTYTCAIASLLVFAIGAVLLGVLMGFCVLQVKVAAP